MASRSRGYFVSQSVDALADVIGTLDLGAHDPKDDCIRAPVSTATYPTP